MHLVLVVAPDKDFRRSLEFALQAEGYSVEAHACVTSALASRTAREASCAVIDDKAVDGSGTTMAHLLANFHKPIVFLAGEQRTPPALPLLVALTKPFLGGPLIDAVHAVIAASGRAAT